MPDDWFGHPLLKTYPLKGDEFARWYEIDKIFGKEYREVVGEEQRDSGFADDKDTLNLQDFIMKCQKVVKKKEISFKQEYQEDEGVAFVKSKT